MSVTHGLHLTEAATGGIIEQKCSLKFGMKYANDSLLFCNFEYMQCINLVFIYNVVQLFG